MPRFLPATLLPLALGACGHEAPPVTAVAVAPAMPSSAVDAAPVPALPAATDRPPSTRVQSVWPFAGAPHVLLYLDLASLAKTPLFHDGLRPFVTELTTRELPEAKTCLPDAFATLEELAYGDDFAAFRFADVRSAQVARACLARLPQMKPAQHAGADESLEIVSGSPTPVREILVRKGDLFLVGAPALVDKALAQESSAVAAPSTWPSSVALANDQYGTFAIDEGKAKQVRLTVTVASTRVAGVLDATCSSEAEAQRSASRVGALDRADVRRFLPPGPEADAELDHLLAAYHAEARGNVLEAGLVLDEPLAEQKKDLAALSAWLLSFVHDTIAQEKVSEARTTVPSLARAYARRYETYIRPGKLPSYPAVPVKVPRGTTYASTPSDWKPYAPLGFTVRAPQRFQYRIVAAKDGKSAEVIAHGDLDGDGKESTFTLALTLDAAGELKIAPELDETSPDD